MLQKIARLSRSRTRSRKNLEPTPIELAHFLNPTKLLLKPINVEVFLASAAR